MRKDITRHTFVDKGRSSDMFTQMPTLSQMPNEDGFIEEGKKKAKKNIDVEMHGLWGMNAATPLVPEVSLTCT